MSGEYAPFSRYETKPNGRGYCCVIANFWSEDGKMISEHTLRGYTKDEMEIKSFFKDMLQYEYRVATNLTKDGVYNELNEIREHLCDKKNSFYDRFFLFFLSHGSRAGLHTCSDETGKDFEIDAKGNLVMITVESITSLFDHGSIPSLKGFPICFFIQSCRGDEMERTAAIPDTEVEGNEEIKTVNKKEEKEDDDFICKIPTPACADILVAFACQDEKVSYVGKFSWFIDAAIETLRNNFKSQHLVDMLVDVNRQVAKKETFKRLGINYVDENKNTYIYDSQEIKRSELTIIAEPDVKEEKKKVCSSQFVYYCADKVVGVIKRVSKTIEPHHMIKCTVKYPPTSTTVYDDEKFSLEEFKKKVLQNKDFVIEEHTCELLENENIVGFGKVTCDGESNQIANRVMPIKSPVRYYGLKQILEKGGENNGFKHIKIEKLDGQAVVITKKDPNFPLYEKVITRGKIQQNKITDPPIIKGPAFQLPIFENTFTRKFYFRNPENMHTVDGKVTHPVPLTNDALGTAGYHGSNSDTNEAEVVKQHLAKVEEEYNKLKKENEHQKNQIIEIQGENIKLLKEKFESTQTVKKKMEEMTLK